MKTLNTLISTIILSVLLLVSIGFFQPAQAEPPLWMDNFGPELSDVSDCDDCEESVVLPFPFPFNGSSFDMAYVGSDGCIQLGGLGVGGNIGFDYWADMQEFLSDSNPDNPLICPFNTDLDTEIDYQKMAVQFTTMTQETR